MAEFIEAARLDELPSGRGTTVTIANKDVALFNVDGTIYANTLHVPDYGVQTYAVKVIDGKILIAL